ncbi:NACHT domain-containing protein [Streptomyces sp. NPDC005355]|uniref:NACHT domain-containing protein n=1 Tax=Streptomyces sp. NPDC005355 TaxID=3157038 RepID=UPI0033B6C3B2
MSADSPGKDTGAAATGGVIPKLSWAAVILLPPSVVAGFWQDVVRDHIYLACGIFLAYGLLLIVGRFVGEFIRDLVLRRRDGWLDSADGRLSRRFSRFGRTYAEYLAASLRFMDQKGLSTIGHYAPELDEVFIDVSLALQAPGRIPGDLLADAGSTGSTDERRSIDEFLDRPKPQVLAIVGAPGTGKTTLLRHTARHACLLPADRRRSVPVLLYLRSLVTDLADNPRLPLAEVIRANLGRPAMDEPAGWFEDRLEAGDCVVLLDGLDEVAEQGMRRTVVDWVEQQIKDYPENDYVITSRPQGYRSTPVEGATVLQTRRFTDRQISTFIHSWYLAVERHANREDSADVQLLAETGASDLQSRLRASPSLYDLTVNPLLLTMIANVHRYRGALPGSRSDLYREICQVMLWRRQESKRLVVEPRGPQKETVLRELAFEMMRRRVTVVSWDVCTEILRSVLPRVSDHLTAEAFLEDVGTNGLLVERENGVFAFAHFTFQEYLAAEYIRDKAQGRLLAEAIDDDWWRECTLLYAANADVGPIVRACLSSGTMAALALAFDCADEGNELDPGLRERLNTLLQRSPAAELVGEERRLMNGVLLTRRLRNIVRTADGGRLCASPVGADTYELFLLDCAEAGTNRRPDAAVTGGVSERPVTGVRAGDAAAFVGWVNTLVGGELRYRLPTIEEMQDPGVQSILCPPSSSAPAHAFWAAPQSDGPPPLWLPPAAQDPRLVPEGVLRQRVRDDFTFTRTSPAALLLLRARAAAAVTVVLLETARNLELDLALARVPDLAAALETSFDGAVFADSDLGWESEALLTSESARVRTLSDVLAQEAHAGHREDLARVLAEDMVRELGTLTGYFSMAGEVPDGFDAVRRAVSALNHDLRRERLRGRRAHEQMLDQVTAFDLSQISEDIGQILPLALARRSVYALAAGAVLPAAAAEFSARLRATGSRDHSSLWTVFEQPLTRTGLLGQNLPPIDPDAVVEGLPRALQAMTARAAHAPYTAWTNELTHKARLAGPILRREALPEGPGLRTARLSAACLAAEAADWGQTDLSQLLCGVVAALTWLEDRHTGAAAATEAIVLAVD